MDLKPLFTIGQSVCTESQTFCEPWRIVGVIMQPNSNQIVWEYFIGRATFTNDMPLRFERSGPYQEHQLLSEETWKSMQQQKLNAAIAEAECRLAELKSRKIL